MNPTGAFNERMKSFFNATEGAYTVFTEEEYRKSTYNMKAVMRNLITNHLGSDYIPRAGDGSDETIRFIVCEYTKAFVQEDYWIIHCKYCKPNRNEVSIYFNKNQHIIPAGCSPRDFWFVFFREGINDPYIGFMNTSDWYDSFGISTEPAPQPVQVPNYTSSVNDLNIQEVSAPVFGSNTGNAPGSHTVAALSPDASAQKAKSSKITGNRAEEIVLRYEKQKLSNAGYPELCTAIDHVAEHTDGAGYDIRSYEIGIDEYGQATISEIYIEVKGTPLGINTPFFVSQNEVAFSREHKDNYYIYRVFGLNDSTGNVSFYKIKGAIEEKFDIVPQNYIATGIKTD